jgi:hypothetical protein
MLIGRPPQLLLLATDTDVNRWFCPLTPFEDRLKLPIRAVMGPVRRSAIAVRGRFAEAN